MLAPGVTREWSRSSDWPAAPTITARRSGRICPDSVPRVRERTTTGAFDAYVAYATARLVGDPRLRVITLQDELHPLVYAGSYQTLTRACLPH